MQSTELVQWFRHSTPYVNLHRGNTFVIMLDGSTVASPKFINIIDDINLLHSLGIKLVIVFGARAQINETLKQQNISEQYHKNIRVTDNTTLNIVKQVIGQLQYDITARLSLRMVSLPNQHSEVPNIVSGNFVIAQPIGVDEGTDYLLSGKIRRVDYQGIQRQLENNSIVLISPVAVSVTGETFNLPFEEIATEVATKLNAEKLIGFCDTKGILDENGETIYDLHPNEAVTYLEKFVKNKQYHTAQARFLQAAIQVSHNGVYRSHLLNYNDDGALLQELFSRDGVGTQVSMDNSETIRIATIQDIPSLLALIQPLEEKGVLVKRSREQLEMEIGNYTIIDRDGVIVACAALNHYPDEKMAEMACVVVHPEYRNSARGDILFEEIKKRAKALGVKKLFILSTRTTHWFQERGFKVATLDDLPKAKKEGYNHQRQSKILTFDLN